MWEMGRNHHNFTWIDILHVFSKKYKIQMIEFPDFLGSDAVMLITYIFLNAFVCHRFACGKYAREQNTMRLSLTY